MYDILFKMVLHVRTYVCRSEVENSKQRVVAAAVRSAQVNVNFAFAFNLDRQKKKREIYLTREQNREIPRDRVLRRK